MSTFNQHIFQKNLHHLRKARKMKQKELAEILGITESSVGGYESGKNLPSIPILVKLSEIFEVSLDKLILDKELPVLNVTAGGVEETLTNAEFRKRIKELESKVAELEGKGEDYKQKIEDYKREINTMRSYSGLLEKTVQRLESDLEKQIKGREHRDTG